MTPRLLLASDERLHRRYRQEAAIQEVSVGTSRLPELTGRQLSRITELQISSVEESTYNEVTCIVRCLSGTATPEQIFTVAGDSRKSNNNSRLRLIEILR